MSNYHYDDQSNCASCRTPSDYEPLKGDPKSDCLPACLDRFNKERSSRDVMDYNFYVLGKMPKLPAREESNAWLKHTYREIQ